MHQVLHLFGKFGNLKNLIIFIHSQFNLLGAQRDRFVDVVLIFEDLNNILSDLFFDIALINIDITSCLICRENESVVHLEWLGILNDFSEMLAPLHVVLTSVGIVSDVSNLFVSAYLIILASLQEVIHVLIIFVVHNNIAVLFSQLEDNITFLIVIFIVGVNQHELAVVGHVVILLDIHIVTVIVTPNLNCILLNQELWILMNEEWSHVFILPLTIVVGIVKIVYMLKLVFVITWIRHRLFMQFQFLWTSEDVCAEGVNSHESIEATKLILSFNVSNLLDCFLKVLHFTSVLLDWDSGVLHTEHLQTFSLIGLLI